MKRWIKVLFHAKTLNIRDIDGFENLKWLQGLLILGTSMVLKWEDRDVSLNTKTIGNYL